MTVQVTQDMANPDPTKAVATAEEYLSDKAVLAYWDQVNRTLVDVFRVPQEDADTKIDDMCRRIDHDVSPDLKVAIFHVDPFQVAADLAGASQRLITPEEKEAYTRIAWGPVPRERPAALLLQRQVPDDALAP